MNLGTTEEEMDADAVTDVHEQQACKYQRLQQIIANGDVTCFEQELEEGPKLNHEDILTLWFAIFCTKQLENATFFMQCFINIGFDPEEADSDSMTALHLSCNHCLKDAVEFLAPKSKNVINEADVFGMLPLHHAISMCKTEGTDDLRSSTDSSSLRNSSEFSSVHEDLPAAEAIVATLLENGAQVNISNSLNQSKPSSYTTPLCFACEIGNMRIVEMLLKAGAEINPVPGRGDGGCPRSCTPLTCALDNTDLAMAEILVAAGADCHARISDEKCIIHVYCERGNLAAVRFLLDKKVDVNTVGNLRIGLDSPLRMATSCGFVDIMELLLKRGASIVSKSPTPLLTTAVYSGNVQAVKLLLQYGSRVNEQANHGKTALYAACMREPEMVRVLLEAGADPNLGNDKNKPICNLLPVRRRVFVTDYKDTVRAMLWHNVDTNVLSTDLFYNRGRTDLSLMHRALLWGDADIVLMLLKFGIPLNGTSKDMLDSFLEACTKPEVKKLLLVQLHTPYSLAQLCRKRIRYCFDYSKITTIRDLPLPQQIVEYLMLDDI